MDNPIFKLALLACFYWFFAGGWETLLDFGFWLVDLPFLIFYFFVDVFYCAYDWTVEFFEIGEND